MKLAGYEVDDNLIVRYYNVIRAIYHDGGNNFTEYGKRRVQIHKEIYKCVGLERYDDPEFNVALDNYLQDLFRKNDYK